MQLISPAAPEIWEQQPGFLGMCEHIARCAAICYNSTPKTGEEAIEFVKRLAKAGHGRALEFGTVMHDTYMDTTNATKYGHVEHICGRYKVVTSNLREWLAMFAATGQTVDEAFNRLRATWDELYTPNVHLNVRRVTVHYPAISRAIADEFARHTTLSTLMRSTRYVNANGTNGVEFIKPSWYEDAEEGDKSGIAYHMQEVENVYNNLLSIGFQRQQARDLLPLCVKTEMVQCGFYGIKGTGWDNFLALRTDKAAHLDARAMAAEISEVLTTI